MSEHPATQGPSIADRLRSVRVGLRDDLRTTRHVFRGQPTYVVSDPLTFQSHRFEPADYEILVSIDSSRDLGQVFESLVERGQATPADEESFYQFVFSLHRMGFLSLPVSDDKLLYRRYQMRRQAKQRQRILGFLFLQIPVWNPDEFLTRTLGWGRLLFSRWFFVVWLLLITLAATAAISSWSEFWQPLNGVLAARNLPLIWLTLILLKGFHEFGHGYACKHFGGHVPEMGIYLIAGTPCAYVDASSSWGFTRRRDRVVVGLAGVYVESIIAALAVLVWAATGSSLANALAYNIVLLAGVMTVLFNANPLMRYDGYFILSDLVGIPNLRGRATQYVLNRLKRIFLGLRPRQPEMTIGTKATLLGFGVAASIYRSLVLLGIAALIATKLYLVGLMLGIFFVGSALFKMARKLVDYLWHAEETAPVRGRAVVASVLVLVGLPTGLLLLPVPHNVTAAGVVAAANETTIHADTPGFVTQVVVKTGDSVAAGQPLVHLTNDTISGSTATAETRLKTARIRRAAYLVDQPALAREEEKRIEACQAELELRTAELEALTMLAPEDGRIVHCVRDSDIGCFVEKGEAVAMLVSGEWQVRALLSDEDFASCQPAVGDTVDFCASGVTSRTLQGTITRIEPVTSDTIKLPALTHAAGGDIVVDPIRGHAQQPFTEVTITLADDAGESLRHGMTGRVFVTGRPEPLGLRAARHLLRFVNKLIQS
ncbi:MAG: hypothetical protein JXO22_11495 [Phycisphaerae bacterium]|nr:hypothetical protein [Phycisphaerae bacterium]